MAPDLRTAEDWRTQVLSDPGLVLDDPELMRALVLASERALGGNVVDLRGLAMERLEARLARLEETHRAVIAAAYENLASTNQIHRALLCLLDCDRFEDFVLALDGEVGAILKVDRVRLVLESADGAGGASLGRLAGVLKVRGPGFVDHYMSLGRSQPPRPVVLRQGIPPEGAPYEEAGADLRSEALMRLDLGPGRLPGLLAMACEDPHRFKPGQGTDLLAFFTGVFERSLRRWLG
jgi:uncharacterized protein YigA (DUF484 family)